MTDVEAELRARAESDGVEFFFAMFVDMHGKPCAKMIPTQALDVLTGGGAGSPGSACYVGECRGGARDAKIALTAEGMGPVPATSTSCWARCARRITRWKPC